MTAVCAYCLARVRIRSDGTCWRHNRWVPGANQGRAGGPVQCSGSGRPPKPNSAEDEGAA